MSIEIKDKDPQPDMPKPKAIIIAGAEVGEVTPTLHGGRITWHSVIQLQVGAFDTMLVQGHGNSPNDSILNGIVAARRRRDQSIEKLAWLETELGTAGQSNKELSKPWGS